MPNEEGFFTQDEVNQLVGEARKEGRTKGEEAGRAALQTELEALRAQLGDVDGLKKGLADKEAALKTYQESFDGMLAARLKGMDEKVKKAIEALPLDSAGKMAWLNEHGGVFAESQGTPKQGRKAPEVEQPRRPLTL